MKFYLSGHYFDYESRNALRIFDLNVVCEIEKLEDAKFMSFDSEYTLCSNLEEQEGTFTSTASLFRGKKLLFSSAVSSRDILLETEDEKKMKKVLVEKAIHSVLKRHYNAVPDYGILTGVRVVKILLYARQNKRTNGEINRILMDTYEVTEEKTKLLWDILHAEEKYVDPEKNKNSYNLYIGIPFCPTKCVYCSFTSFVHFRENTLESYLDTLIFEIQSTIQMAIEKGLKLHTIYVGGGTPSVLSEKQIDRLFDCLRKFYNLSDIEEITFEAGRPDTITPVKLDCLKKNGVTRISINPQTMNEETLKSMGRLHKPSDILEAYKAARIAGFDINMDMILGLPGETKEDVKNTITEIVKLMPENITVHSLAYKKKSELTKESTKLDKDYDLIKHMHDEVMEACRGKGYKPYYMYRQKNIKGNSENVGYALHGKESIYNMVIIEELETILACGIGASSKIMLESNRHEPVRNFKSIEEYLGRIDEIIEKKRNLLS
ncbi:MAG: coproporphyrinogen dehydrogenase HemZ [Sedimentibacter sp.]|uniref:coproporphyrinogen dehydrogenase HemZ n=1 Tax=Sedimentibacter sp. TaxID=1960295 RepID=UPI00315934AF